MSFIEMYYARFKSAKRKSDQKAWEAVDAAIEKGILNMRLGGPKNRQQLFQEWSDRMAKEGSSQTKSSFTSQVTGSSSSGSSFMQNVVQGASAASKAQDARDSVIDIISQAGVDPSWFLFNPNHDSDAVLLMHELYKKGVENQNEFNQGIQELNATEKAATEEATSKALSTIKAMEIEARCEIMGEIQEVSDEDIENYGLAQAIQDAKSTRAKLKSQYKEQGFPFLSNDLMFDKFRKDIVSEGPLTIDSTFMDSENKALPHLHSLSDVDNENLAEIRFVLDNVSLGKLGLFKGGKFKAEMQAGQMLYEPDTIGAKYPTWRHNGPHRPILRINETRWQQNMHPGTHPEYWQYKFPIRIEGPSDAVLLRYCESFETKQTGTSGGKPFLRCLATGEVRAPLLKIPTSTYEIDLSHSTPMPFIVSPGTYDFSFAKNLFPNSTCKIDVLAGQVVTVTLAFRPKPTVEVTVTQKDPRVLEIEAHERYAEYFEEVVTLFKKGIKGFYETERFKAAYDQEIAASLLRLFEPLYPPSYTGIEAYEELSKEHKERAEALKEELKADPNAVSENVLTHAAKTSPEASDKAGSTGTAGDELLSNSMNEVNNLLGSAMKGFGGLMNQNSTSNSSKDSGSASSDDPQQVMQEAMEEASKAAQAAVGEASKIAGAAIKDMSKIAGKFFGGLGKKKK